MLPALVTVDAVAIAEKSDSEYFDPDSENRQIMSLDNVDSCSSTSGMFQPLHDHDG